MSIRESTPNKSKAYWKHGKHKAVPMAKDVTKRAVPVQRLDPSKPDWSTRAE